GADGVTVHLVQQLLWIPVCGNTPLRSVSRRFSRVSATVDDGEQRQRCNLDWNRRDSRYRPYLLGGTGNQRSTFLSSASTSGNKNCAVRLHRFFSSPAS